MESVLESTRKFCPTHTTGTCGEDASTQESSFRTACSGLCAAGYFCPTGSTSPTAYPCGAADVYCPPGSGRPKEILSGWYSAGGDDLKNNTRTVAFPCVRGSYCVQGRMFPCPGGTYGADEGLSGLVVGSSIGSESYGDALEHLRSARKVVSQYTGLEGSDGARPVFNYNNLAQYRDGKGDPKVTHFEGRASISFGDAVFNREGKVHQGLTTSMCTGWCPPGHECPPRTVDPIPCPVGSYATGGAAKCSSCCQADNAKGNAEQVQCSATLLNDPASQDVCRDSRLCCSHYSSGE